ncbi:hypothetical protein IG631_04444 [Alternaria alternata]|nr:hypothetical protein IG631_04444 [Alternaria alternata]
MGRAKAPAPHSSYARGLPEHPDSMHLPLTSSRCLFRLVKGRCSGRVDVGGWTSGALTVARVA